MIRLDRYARKEVADTVWRMCLGLASGVFLRFTGKGIVIVIRFKEDLQRETDAEIVGHIESWNGYSEATDVTV